MSSKATGTQAARAFIGTWVLESFTEKAEASGLHYPLGTDPVGILIYTEDGSVSAQLMKTGRKALNADSWEVADAAGLAELADGYIRRGCGCAALRICCNAGPLTCLSLNPLSRT